MIEIKKVQTTNGHRIDCFLESEEDHLLDAQDLMLFPALIDPHVHFRVPGAEYKEDWTTAARAAIAGGVTTVIDMPNNTPSCCTVSALQMKKALVQEQLRAVGIPLRAHFYFGVDQNHLSEIPKVKDQVTALKIYMGSSTGELLVNRPQALKEAFRLAAQNELLVAVHAEDEALLQAHAKQWRHRTDVAIHSLIRGPDVARKAVEQAIRLAEDTKARLYLVHISTKGELDLIRQAKQKGLSVYAEVTPHHLFLDDSAYHHLGTRAVVNPPLRSRSDVEALWEALNDDTIDTIGTDHAPHTLEEKMQPYGQAPSGLPSIEFYFALLLNAYSEGKLSLEQIVSLTHTRPQEIFHLPLNDDVVLVDLERVKTIDQTMILSKAGWSPYLGRKLRGWPCYTINNGRLFDLEQISTRSV
jgi:dihydroorotase